jgi:hypothetical protein
MANYKVISGSVQYGRTQDKRRMVANLGETVSDKQINAASAARLVHLGVLELVKAADVIDVEAKVVKDQAEKAAAEKAEAEKAAAEKAEAEKAEAEKAEAEKAEAEKAAAEKAAAEKAAAETKQGKAPAAKLAKSDVPAFLSGT